MSSNDNDGKNGTEIEINDSSKDNESKVDGEHSIEPKEVPEEDNVTPINSDINDPDDLNERYVRLAADFENYKKRLAKEKADIIAYGNEELIKVLLNVLDNLERALEHTDEEIEKNPLVEGMKLVHKQFISCLEKFGVYAIDANKGTEFDPRLHQAIERVESPEISHGLILSEMLRGFTLKDRLLRPSLVVVSKGTPGQSDDIVSPESKNEGSENDNVLNLNTEKKSDNMFSVPKDETE